MINKVKPDIIFGTESWLKPKDINDFIKVYRKDRTCKIGGVFNALGTKFITF